MFFIKLQYLKIYIKTNDTTGRANFEFKVMRIKKTLAKTELGEYILINNLGRRPPDDALAIYLIILPKNLLQAPLTWWFNRQTISPVKLHQISATGLRVDVMLKKKLSMDSWKSTRKSTFHNSLVSKSGETTID